MRRRKKIKEIRKLKRKIRHFLFFVFLLLSFLFILLGSYLFDIQKVERLSSKSDYKDYTITYTMEHRCQTKERVKTEDVTYLFDCLDMVYVSFGSTKITFEEAIMENYLTYTSLLENTTLKEKVDGASIYKKKKDDSSCLIKISEDESKHIFVTLMPNEKDSKSE